MDRVEKIACTSKRIVFFFIGTAALAQAKIEELSLKDLLNIPVQVGSTKATTVFTSPSTVSVIDQDMIRNYGFQSIAEALNTVAGFSVLRTASRQEIPTSRGILQDHFPNKVLFMINDVPTWNPVTSEMGPLDRVSINDVERIEVLKRPASVLYGTNAYTGAINIVLKSHKSGAPTQGMATGRVAEKYGLGSGVSLSGGSEAFSFFVAGNSFSERGDNRFIVGSDGKGVKYSD